MKQRTYIAIDLKSFYASVECMERKLDPMTTNLVVADESRTQKTIGLAVSPSLKSFGIPGRPRLFEVVQKVKEVNNDMAKIMKLYHENSIDVPVRVDHVPTMVGENMVNQGYDAIGRYFAIGYLKGIIQSVC